MGCSGVAHDPPHRFGVGRLDRFAQRPARNAVVSVSRSTRVDTVASGLSGAGFERRRSAPGMVAKVREKELPPESDGDGKFQVEGLKCCPWFGARRGSPMTPLSGNMCLDLL